MKSGLAVGSVASAVTLGVVLMLFGDLLFAINDVVGKWLVASFALGQVLVMRSLGSLIVLAPMITHQNVRTFFSVRQPGCS